MGTLLLRDADHGTYPDSNPVPQTAKPTPSSCSSTPGTPPCCLARSLASLAIDPVETPPATPPSPCSCPPRPAVSAARFPRFMDLPTELRLKIWHLSFTPRVVEVHRRKLHYADSDAAAYYQSWSANPPALAVGYEARACALRHYTAAIRLAVNTPCELAGGVRLDLFRRLYIAPQTDTLALLGDFNVAQTVHLLDELRRADPLHFPQTKLAICASAIGQASLLLIYGRTIFNDIEQLTLFLYKRRMPPADWLDGHCALVDCRGTYQYRRFVAKQTAELRAHLRGSGQQPAADAPGTQGPESITVGRRSLQVRELVFGAGAALQDEALSAIGSPSPQSTSMPTTYLSASSAASEPPTPPIDSFFRY